MKNRDKGGDEYVMDIKATEAKTELAFFTKGTYRVRVELKQKKGKTLISGNPMGIAINIETVSSAQITDARNLQSWQENPMGLALTIKAPKAPIAAASVGVATPAKIDPSTRKIKITGRASVFKISIFLIGASLE